MARPFIDGIDLQGQRAQNAGSAVTTTDLVTFGQAQNMFQGQPFKQAARLAATTNVNLSSPGSVFDGVAANVSDRIFLPFQTAGAQNGVYTFNGGSSALTRTADASQGTLNVAAVFPVSAGVTYAGTNWQLLTLAPFTVDTTALQFQQLNIHPIVYRNGSGILFDPNTNTFSLDTSYVLKFWAGNVGDGSSTTITLTHGLGTQDLVPAFSDTATRSIIDVDISFPTINTVRLVFASAPSTNQYRIVLVGR